MVNVAALVPLLVTVPRVATLFAGLPVADAPDSIRHLVVIGKIIVNEG
jgi:hypothetical protein